MPNSRHAYNHMHTYRQPQNSGNQNPTNVWDQKWNRINTIGNNNKNTNSNNDDDDVYIPEFGMCTTFMPNQNTNI